MKCLLCDNEYDNSAICCPNCYPFIKGSFLEKRLEMAKAIDNLRSALLKLSKRIIKSGISNDDN